VVGARRVGDAGQLNEFSHIETYSKQTMNQQSKITANSKNRASDLTGERTGVQGGVEPRKASPPRTPRTRKVTTLDMPTKDKVLDTETKKMVQYVSSIVNLSTGKRYRCWWCTLTIDNEPIGCPIGVKFSYPDNDPQATEGRRRASPVRPAARSEITTYSTDGVFCSFNCAKAYINEKERANVMYKNSNVLLAHMVCDMNGRIAPVSIEPSPDKRLLIEYGGHMTEHQYRQCFDRMLYTEKGIIKMFPTTVIFQEEEKLNRGGSRTPTSTPQRR